MTTQLRRAQSGDQQAFASIVRENQRLVRATALAHTGDYEVAQDVAQEAFLLTWKRLSRVEPGRLQAYLVAVTRNLAHNARRRRKETHLPCETIDSSLMPDEIVASKQELQLIQRALQRIPVRLRAAVILYYQHERSTTEVASILGISSAAARQRISRGTRRLKGEFESGLAASIQARDRKSAGFVAGVVGSLPTSVPATASPFSIVGFLLGKKLLASLIALACSVGAVVGFTGAEVPEVEAKAPEPSPAKVNVASSKDSLPPESPIDDDLLLWAAPPWSEVPLVVGMLKLNRPELDTDGDGELSDPELLAFKDDQAEILSSIILDAVQTAQRARHQSALPKRMHRALLSALRKHDLIHEGVLRVPIQIFAPMWQFSVHISQTQPIEYVVGEQSPSRKGLIAELIPGTPLTELKDLQWGVPLRVTETVAAYCERVHFRQGAISQERMYFALAGLPALLGSDTVDPELLLPYLRSAIGESSLCVEFGLVYEHPMSDGVAYVRLDQKWDALKMLILEARGLSINLQPALP